MRVIRIHGLALESPMTAADITYHDEVGALYRDHHGWLHGWLKRRLDNAGDAADLAQDAFVRLIASRTRQRFDSIGQARAYLRTTAQNLCINLWRRQEIERAWLETLAATPPQHHPSAERQAVVLQALEEIAAVLHSLSPKAAQAFTLAVICDMTDDEVGAELGISGRMVRKYVARAMTACLTSRARETALDLRGPNGV
jgi:RNA polymerase sigma-70 factor (ECF subfamily)